MKTAKQHNDQLTGEIEIIKLNDIPCIAPIAGSVEMLYHELIMAVSKKFPNETRHETALRYIRECEDRCSGPCKSNRSVNEDCSA